MKRTMYQAARHTPKRQATGSNPAGGAKKIRCKRFLCLQRIFILLCFSVWLILPVHRVQGHHHANNLSPAVSFQYGWHRTQDFFPVRAVGRNL